MRILQQLVFAIISASCFFSSFCPTAAAAAAAATASAALECRSYSVELKATYPNQTVVPCSEEQNNVVQTLIHALVQVDVIVGMGGSLMIPDKFDLAYEAYGPHIQKIMAPSAADEFSSSQRELAAPHLTTEDELEDMYYQVDNDLQKDLTNTGSNAQEKDEEDFQPPPPPLKPMDGSLRAAPARDSDNPKPVAQDTHENRRKLSEAGDPETENEECSADMCTWFLSTPCPEADIQAPSDNVLVSQQDKQRIVAFNARVKNAIAKKLRKWARDNNIHCLGNSWELDAVVNTRI